MIPAGEPSARTSPLPWKLVGLNSFWLFMARLATQIQLILFTLLAARGLGVADFGQYSFIASTVVLGNVVTSFGTDTYIIRELASKRRGGTDLIGTSLILQLVLAFLYIALVFLWSAFLPQASFDEIIGLRVYSLALIPLAFFSVYSAVLRARERMDLFLVVNLLGAVLQTGIAWVALHQSVKLVPFMGVLLFTQVAIAITAGIVCWRLEHGFITQLGFNGRQLVSLLRMVWPLAFLSILGVGYQRVGILTLSILKGDLQTGWFSVAVRMTEALKFANIAVLGALLPMTARLFARRGGEKEIGQLFNTTLLVLLGLAILSAVSVSILAPLLIPAFFGAKYLPSIPLIRSLIWVLVPYTLSSSISLRWIVWGRERMLLFATMIGSGIGLGLNLWLVHTNGAAGASLAAVLNECSLAAILILMRQRVWEQST